MLKTLSIFCVILFTISEASVPGVIDINDVADREQLLYGISSGFPKLQRGDLDTLYYAVRGYDFLKETVPRMWKMDGCGHLGMEFEKATVKEYGVESIYRGLATWNTLGCDGKAHKDPLVNEIKAALEKPESTADIRFGIEALNLLKVSIPSPNKIGTALQQKLKDDDSLVSLGNALHAAALLGSHGKFMSNRIEDIIVQADEVDGTMLQYEGGLSVTSTILTGLYKFVGAKALNPEQVDKFGKYLLSRKSVQQPKGCVLLLESADVLPAISITIANKVISQEKPQLIVRVSDLLGRSLKSAPSPVIAQSATRIADDVVVLSKQTLKQGSRNIEYVLDLKVDPGLYKFVLSAGTHQATPQIRITGPVQLNSFEIGLGDSDGSQAPKLVKLTHPAKVPAPLSADNQQNLIAKFSLSRPVHQAFIRVFTDKREIIFIAERDSSGVYKLNVDLAKELFTGTYAMELILGDASMSNPMVWNLGTITLTQGNAAQEKVETRKAKPEINHMFRQAEKRPAQVVSLLFTVLAGLPLIILVIYWASIGVKLNTFNFYSLPFHLGYSAIMGLYVYFWLYGNMFSTVAYLFYIGGFTFIAGNRMLRKIATSGKEVSKK